MSSKNKKQSPRRLLGCAAFCFSLVLGAALLVLADFYLWTQRPMVQDAEQVQFSVPEGTSWPEFVRLLTSEGLVTKPRYFDIWGRTRGLPQMIKAGRYTLDGPIYLEEASGLFAKGGQAEDLVVTILEGWTIFHIADKLEAAQIVSRNAFLNAARSPTLLEEAGIEAESFEGYLFPDTYRFSTTVSAEEIVERMHSRFKDIYQDVSTNRGPDTSDWSDHKIITLASLIERETRSATERPRIARVFLNRLDRNMRLQTDPTCVYSEETYREIPHPRFCKDRLNRYSTYVIDGLPPGPIANPGRASLQAALRPSTLDEDKDYLFFVAKRDGSGNHHFSKTYDEHRRRVRLYLKGD